MFTLASPLLVYRMHVEGSAASVHKIQKSEYDKYSNYQDKGNKDYIHELNRFTIKVFLIFLP